MNHDETSASPVEGEDAHQGPRGLDAFSVQLSATELGANGASGGVPGEDPSTSTETPEAERARKRREALAANTWKNRGAELAAHVLRRVEGAELPIATPWPSVNARMGGGLWPGMHVVVGGTGTGKSQWAMQVSLDAARAGVPVLVLSLELDALGVFARAASFFTQDKARKARDDGSALPAVKWSAFYTGGRASTPEKTERDRARVREALPHVLPAMEALPLHWYEAPPHGLPHTEIAALAADLRALHPEHTGPVLVVVDFLQLVAGAPRDDGRPDPREDSITRVSRASYACRAVARECSAVVLVLSSTSRANEKDTRIKAREEPAKPPSRALASTFVGFGKESGDVEFSADSVLVLCPEETPEAPSSARPSWMKPGRPVHLAVAKLRAGAPGWCELRFNGSRFIEAPSTPRDGEAWCEKCDAFVRVSPLSDGVQLCTRAGHKIEASPEDVTPEGATSPGKGSKRKRTKAAPSSAPSEHQAKGEGES